MSKDQFDYYTVCENDTLSDIGQRNGITWHSIADLNGINDPRDLRPGQRLKIPIKQGKIRVHVLDADHNPLSGLEYLIQSGEKLVSGITSTGGAIEEFWPSAVGNEVEISVRKLSGEWKKIYSTVSTDAEKLVTLVSPRLKLTTEMQPHPSNSADAAHTPTARKKAAPSGKQTSSKFVPDKGIKTQQTIDHKEASRTLVTSDDATFDDFLDKYTGEQITEEDYKDAAKELACKVSVIKAVHETEVGAGSFVTINGRVVPKILYERHYFYKLTGKKYWDSNPDLSFPVGFYSPGSKYIKKKETLTKTDGASQDVEVWVKFNQNKDKDHAAEAETGKQLLAEGTLTKERDTYGIFSYRRLCKAFKLDATAALQSCSWGAFQIMGTNYKTLGYASVQEMVRALSRSERPHLKGFIKFVKANSVLLRAVQQEDFTTFAKHYNGPSYRENDYDGKMRRNFGKFEKLSRGEI